MLAIPLKFLRPAGILKFKAVEGELSSFQRLLWVFLDLCLWFVFFQGLDAFHRFGVRLFVQLVHQVRHTIQIRHPIGDDQLVGRFDNRHLAIF